MDAVGIRPVNFSVTFLLFLEEFFDFGYVFGDVHAYGVVVYFGDADFPASGVVRVARFFRGCLGGGWDGTLGGAQGECVAVDDCSDAIEHV